MARGRPRKAGKRSKGKSNRPSRAGMVENIVKGNDRAEARKSEYGSEGGDCLGRAFVKGLLGDGDEAKDRLDKGRKFARIYTRVYRKPYRCALNDNPRGAENHDPSDWQIAEEEWLKNNIVLIDPAGRPFFDQLVIPHSPLDDPYWLADLLQGRDHHADRMVLKAALRGLDEIELNPPERAKEPIDFLAEMVFGSK